MSRSTLTQWAQKLFRRRRSPRKARPRARIRTFEQLGERITPSVNAFSFGGILTVFGDSADNRIVVDRNAAGDLEVNGGDVKIFGSKPTVGNTALIQMFGQAGNDELTLDEANGALPKAILFGGAGNDTLTGGSANDYLFGQAGNDSLLGKGGFDFLFGGAGDDTLTGGDADDSVFGEAGNDRMIWNPGDDTDLNEGGAGTDTVEVNGGNGAEDFTVTQNGARVRFDRVNPAPFSIDIGTSEKLVLNANGGNDTFSATGNLAGLIQITVDGGVGNDTINGSNGNDTLLGGDGDDTIDGNAGADTALLGAGDDTFIWDPGDGSDTVEGQDGTDTLRFNGAGLAESVDISANGNRVRFTRDLGNIVMDLNGLETVEFNALGGADKVTVNDLTGTDVTQVNLNLANTLGGATGDGAADLVTVNGTSGDDAVTVSGSAGNVIVLGLAAQININTAEPALDTLVVNGLAGDDAIVGVGLAADTIKYAANGGTGDDVLLGGDGDDMLAGNEGDDTLIGGPGIDILDGGPGSNTVIQ